MSRKNRNDDSDDSEEEENKRERLSTFEIEEILNFVLKKNKSNIVFGGIVQNDFSVTDDEKVWESPIYRKSSVLSSINIGSKYVFIELWKKKGKKKGHYIYHEFHFKKGEDGLVIVWRCADSLQYTYEELKKVKNNDLVYKRGSWAWSILSYVKKFFSAYVETCRDEYENFGKKQKYVIDSLGRGEYSIEIPSVPKKRPNAPQSDSESCGYYCVYFVYLTANNIPHELWTEEEFLEQGNRNERELYAIVRQMRDKFKSFRTLEKKEPVLEDEIPDIEKEKVEKSSKKVKK